MFSKRTTKSVPSSKSFVSGREGASKASMICFRCWLTFWLWPRLQLRLMWAPFWTTFNNCHIISTSISATMTRGCLTGFEIRLNVSLLIELDVSKKIGWTVVWQDFAFAVQPNVPAVALDSMFPGVSTTVRQSDQCFLTISYYLLVRNNIFCSHCDENQIQIETEHWRWHMGVYCVCQTYHHVWTNSAVKNRHTFHTEYSAIRKRLVIIGDWSK